MKALTLGACIVAASIHLASDAAALTRTPSRTPTRTPTSNRPLPIPRVTITPSPVVSGETVTLDARASGGAISGYEWKQTGGAVTIDIENRFSSLASFVAPQVEEPTAIEIEIGLSAFNPTVVRERFDLIILPTESATFIVNGTVAEFPSGCSGAMRGFTVTLNPLGLETQTDLSVGGFGFEGIPPGNYTLSVGPACNPFGCWPPTEVTVVDEDVTIRICPIAATPTHTPTRTPTPMREPSPATCAGDCDDDGVVTIGEVVRAARSVLNGLAAPCETVDANRDGIVDLAELIETVHSAINGCE